MTASAKVRIFVNGRFLRGPITGTSRVAEEILAAWDRQLAADEDLRRRIEIVLLRPRRRLREVALQRIVQKDVHRVGGKLWELVDLPFAARRGVLINFANISPFVHPCSMVYIHDAQVFLHPDSYPPIERMTHGLLLKLGGRTARRVITISNFSARMLVRYGIAAKDKIVVVHNGADHILRQPAETATLARYGLVPNKYVLMFGSGFAYKNNRIVYEAYRRLGSAAPQLAVIGRADERRRFEDILNRDADNVVLLTDLSDGALRALYSNALVFVAPSRTEGYPMTPLEALNCGCPVITTPEGSMLEVLGDAVDYVGADDAEGWANKILTYARDPGRREPALARACALAGSKTWARTAEEVLKEVEAAYAEWVGHWHVRTSLGGHRIT
jgi:glycosyltransferase involved in cell wall biosynthesis